MDNDEQRDAAEEKYGREFCQACGTSPCGWDGKPDGFHTDPLDAAAARLAGRLQAVGVNAEAGLGGSVVIYADDEDAALFLAALGQRDRGQHMATTTFAQWRRDNSGTLADYEHWAAAQASQPVTPGLIQAEADRERRNLLEAAAREHEENITAELRRFTLALAHIEITYQLRLTAVPGTGTITEQET
jgi:hypothetical protein